MHLIRRKKNPEAIPQQTMPAVVENTSDLRDVSTSSRRRRSSTFSRRRSSLMSYDPSELEPVVHVEGGDNEQQDSVTGDQSLYSIPQSITTASGRGVGRSCYQSAIASRSFKAFSGASSVRHRRSKQDGAGEGATGVTGGSSSIATDTETERHCNNSHQQHNVRTDDVRTIVDAVSHVLEEMDEDGTNVVRYESKFGGGEKKRQRHFYVSDVSFEPKGCRWDAKVVIPPEQPSKHEEEKQEEDEDFAYMLASHLNVHDDEPLQFQMQLTCSAVMAAPDKNKDSSSSHRHQDHDGNNDDDDNDTVCTLGTIGVDTVYVVDTHLLDDQEETTNSSCITSSSSTATVSTTGTDSKKTADQEQKPVTEQEKRIRQAFDEISLEVKKALIRTELPDFPEGCKGKSFRKVYQLNKRLKAGSIGTVCRATHRATGKKVAVKCVLRSKLRPSDDAAIYDEVLVLSSLKHRYICPLLDFFIEDECYFLVMELMTGGDLFDRIGSKRNYNERDARNLCAKMLDAVAFCHEHHIAHCDIKPKNLLLISQQDDSHIKLADFGFATRVYSQKSLTQQHGTPFFVAPEILLREKYDCAADMWSVGVTIYLLLSGDFPFTGKNQRDLFRRIVDCQYDFAPKDKWDLVSDEAKDLIKKLLVVDPDKRYTAKQALESSWIRRTRGAVLVKNQLNSPRQQLATLSNVMKKKTEHAKAG